MTKSFTLKCFTLIVFTLTIFNIQSNAQIITKKVDPILNPLADSLVRPLVGRGVIVQNIKSNIRETGNAIGTVKDNTGLLGIPKGLLLTTSRVDSLPRPNGPTFTGPENNPAPGNVLSVQIPGTDTIGGVSIGRNILNRVLASGAGSSTRRAVDVATVEFEVIAATDSLEFRYMFFSEEYPAFVCSNFNDIFGFFITGPGIVADTNLASSFPNTKNLAIIPGTNLPVAINTVNIGIPGTAGVASNCTFTPEGIAAYRSNQSPASPLWNFFKFDGYTVVLTAKVKVQPCEVYRLVMTVADVNDGSFDSGVIIETGSLKGTGVVTFANSVFGVRFPYMIVGCNDGKFLFKRCGLFLEDSITIRWKIEGTAVNGQDYMRLMPNGSLQMLADTFVLRSGKDIDSIMIRGLDNPTWDGVEEKQIILRYLDQRQPYLNDTVPNFAGEASLLRIRRRFIYDTGPDSIRICPRVDTSVTPISALVPTDRYLWREVTFGDTAVPVGLSCDTCVKPLINIDTTRRYVVFVTDSASGCVAIDTITINVFQIPNAILSSSEPNFAVCEGRSITIFANPPDSDPTWTYSWSAPTPPNQLGGPLNSIAFTMFRTFQTDTLNLRITNQLGCYFDTIVVIRVAKNPVFELPTFDTLCGYVPIDIVPVSMQDTIGGQYFWTVQGGVTPLGRQPSLTYTPTQNVTLVLSVSNACTGVQGSVSKEVQLFVKDSLNFVFEVPKIVCEGTASVLTAPTARRDSVRFGGWFDTVEGSLVYADSIVNEVFPATQVLFSKMTDRCYTYWKPITIPVVPNETPVITVVAPQDTLFPIVTRVGVENANSYSAFNWKVIFINNGVERQVGESALPAFDARFEEPTEYRLELSAIKTGIFGTDTIGCVNTNTQEVKLKGELIIPSLITKNGDGKNDAFRIGNFRRGLRLTIINRWGREVFKSSGDYANDFNPPDDMKGIHYYYIQDSRGNRQYRGWFNVVE
jgi:hypothetical protein